MVDIEKVNEILSGIYSLRSPAISEAKRSDVLEFLKIAVNGDLIKTHLIINAGLGNAKLGALVYILTDARLITLSISDTGEAESSSYKLDTMIGVSRKLDDGKMQIRVTFQGEKFVGLKYPITSEHITTFFQRIDQEQVKETPNG